ncbi:MAG: hypothetical protein ACLT33_12125 [Lachnospira pectinoschiza]
MSGWNTLCVYIYSYALTSDEALPRLIYTKNMQGEVLSVGGLIWKM